MAVQANDKKIVLPLENMESEHCASIVQKGLEQVDGINSSSVELNNHRAIVSATDNEVIATAVQAVKDLGYGVTSIKKTFPVLGMSCASCASSAETITKSQDGVIKAEVNFATGNLSVEYLPNIIDAEGLQKAIQSVGYDLRIDEDEKQETIDEIHERKYKVIKRKTIFAVLLSLPIVLIEMVFPAFPAANLIMWILSTVVVAWLGRSFFINAWKQAKHRSVNMDTLVALSTGITYLFSVFTMFFPDFWTERGIEAHVYFEAAAVIITFILLGRLLEEKAKGNTSFALKKLMGLQPKVVTVIRANGEEVEISVDEVEKGDVIKAKPGDKIAVDGEVSSGHSYVDESMLSGEPVPVSKDKGEKVFAGTINQKGGFQYKASKVGKETLLSQIIKTVEEAQGSKAPVQRLVDKIASIFVPIIMSIAILALILWMILGGANGVVYGILAAVTVLIIACPCALGLATPTAIMVGVGKGAEMGILIKDAESLESAKKMNALVLDKTGTITEGKPQVTDVQWLENQEEKKNILWSLEKQSEHPLAEAVVNHFDAVDSVEVSHFDSITGKGAKANYNDQTYFVGNKKLLDENKIAVSSDLENRAKTWENQAKTVIWFSDHKQALGVLAISDQIKSTSKKAIQALQNDGIDLYMLTGDNEATAQAIAEETGIHHYQAGFLPQDKADFVKKLQEKGKVVGMVGDGINDSTALATADVSIAMGQGSDIAMDVAKMTIISSDLSKISTAINLSQHTVATIRQNLFWAFIYNIIGVPIAAGILFPINGFLLNPMIAGGAMALSSVSVVSNSLRLKWKKIKVES